MLNYHLLLSKCNICKISQQLWKESKKEMQDDKKWAQSVHYSTLMKKLTYKVFSPIAKL